MNANQDAPTVAPFLNEYKRKFVVKRLVQNICSGLVFKINSDDELPWFLYILQIVLFLVPFLFGGVGILVTDLSGVSRLNTSIITAVIFFLYLVILKSVSTLVLNFKHVSYKNLNNSKSNQKRPSNIRPETGKASRANNFNLNIIDDEMNYVFDAPFFSINTLNFILPPAEFFLKSVDSKTNLNTLKLVLFLTRVLFDSAFAGLLMFNSVYFESIVYLQSFFSITGASCIFIFNWIVLCMAFYSLCIREPPEPAIYQSYDQFKIQHYNRAFYVFCFQLIELIYK